LLLFFASGIAGTTAGCLVDLWLQPGQPYMGATAPITALLTAWGFVHQGQQMLFFGRLPVKAHVVAAIFVCVPLLAMLRNGQFGALLGDLVAIATGFLMTRGFLDPQAVLRRARSAATRRRYRVIDGGKGPPYMN
jgi:hypothetical protein